MFPVRTRTSTSRSHVSHQVNGRANSNAHWVRSAQKVPAHSGSGFTHIGEQVAVVGTYNHSTFRPRKFQWRGKVYPIDELTFVTDTRDEGVRCRMYSVVSGGNLYRLIFNRDAENWQLAEVWCE